MRNMLGMVILHMVKMRPEDAQLLQQQQHKNLTMVAECGHSVLPQSVFGVGASLQMQYISSWITHITAASYRKVIYPGRAAKS